MLPSGARDALQLHDSDLRIEPLVPGRFLYVHAPADFDWTAASQFVSQRAAKCLRAMRCDTPVANLDAVRRREAAADDEASAATRERWRASVEHSAWGHLLRTQLLRLREIERDRARAWDPRLEPVVAIAAAFERLWQARLGAQWFERWMEGAEAGVDGDSAPAPTFEVATRDKLVGVADPDWLVVQAMAWARCAESCRSVEPHVLRVADRAEPASGRPEAAASRADDLRRLARRLRLLARDGDALGAGVL